MSTTKRPGLSGLRSAIRLDDLKHDPWGTAMAWGFGVCTVLDVLGESIPDEWGYRRAIGDERTLAEIGGDPGADEPEEDLEYPDCEVALMAISAQVDAETLLYWGRILHRYLGLCKRRGRAY